MKKIPTLFQREYLNHEVVKVLDIVTEGCEWVLAGEGTATLKHDGSCCCIINGELYKRYDAKNGKPVPEKRFRVKINQMLLQVIFLVG